ncbi:phage tail protein [Paenarthrobacter sp. A20]|uniref:phage tail protein n=1 Tax=Paenarthrobacter sp. A20 TaxID=2817891 RepID=UPI0020A068A7|nr:phage tail protein [Paenarthrobacter sp. A20]MCP1410991.1 phage tail-like protein [Paenarthrobacter sp. A20]
MANTSDVQASKLLKVLPEVFQVAADTSAPMQALLAVAEDMHQPVRQVLDRLHTVPDPGRAPASLIPFLSRWVDLDWLTLPGAEGAAGGSGAVPITRQRDLIAAAAQLSSRRGTVDGLTRFLHLATGVAGFDVESVPGAFHIKVLVPADAAGQLELIGRIVKGVKPAHITDEIEVRTGE